MGENKLIKVLPFYRFLDIVLIALLVMSGGGLLFVFHRNPLTILLFLISFFTLIINQKKIEKPLFNSSVLSIIVFSSLILINYITSIGDQKFIKYVFHLLNILSCIIIIIHFFNNRDRKYFLSILRFVLRIVLFFSLVNFIIYPFVKGSLNTIFYNIDKVVYSFGNLFFYNPERSSLYIYGIEFVRNQGWFWEPGINQIYLNILLYLEGLIYRRSRLIIILIILAVFTTYSTTGLVIMLVIIFFIFRSYLRKNPILILFSMFLLIPTYYIAKNNINDKLETSSFQKRYFDFIQTISITKDYPITGIGLDFEHFASFRNNYYLSDEVREDIESYTGQKSNAKSKEKGSSNSITFLFAAMGIPMSIFLMFCMYRQNLFKKNKLVFLFIIVLSLFSEPLLFRPFYLMLIVSGMTSFFYKFTK
tara:strand:+ start:42428 stop:43684 length:1257 start_codon:yes stop_codon:yes gene_type:complete